MQIAHKRPALQQGDICVVEKNREFLRDIYSDKHHLLADEPAEHHGHGSDLGFDPYELLMASLGACTSMTVRMYANHKGWPLDNVEVNLHHQKIHEEDGEGGTRAIDQLARTVKVSGNLSQEQMDRLLDVANKCPVYRTLTGQLRISSSLEFEVTA
jgi:uncharacterized OsmC-like protein